MPVSGNEEPGVLSRQSSAVSAGIPLKKRRFLLVQPPSPPRQEIQPAAPEENDTKKVEDSSSNMSVKEESTRELKNKEESHPDLKGKEEFSSAVKNKGEFRSKFKSIEASESDLNNKAESGANEKNKEDSIPDQGSINPNVANSSLGMPGVGKNSLIEVKKEIAAHPDMNLVHSDVDASGSKLLQLSPMANMGSVSKLDSGTKLLLTEKCVRSESSGTTGANVVDVKKGIHSTVVDEDCKLKLSTGSVSNELSLGPSSEPLASGLGFQDTERKSAKQDNLDTGHTALLSLSFNKGKTTVEEKNNDTSSHSDTANYSCSNRSKWDLNTTMDNWEGPAGDGAFQGNIDASSKKLGVNVINPSVSSVGLGIDYGSKGKQVILTDAQRPIFSTSSVQKNHHHEDTTLRLTLSAFSRASSARVASSVDVSNPSVSAVNTNSLGCGPVKTEPIDENPKTHPVGATGSDMGLIDFGSVKREPVERNNVEAVRLSTKFSQKLIEQKSIKLEQATEVSGESCKTGDMISQHSVANIVQCQECGSSSSSSVLPMPLTPQKCSPSRLVTSSELSGSIDVSNQSERSIHTKKVQKSNDAVDQAAAADMVHKSVHLEREAKLSENKSDTLDTCEAEVRNVDDPAMSGPNRKYQNSHDNHEGSASDEEKINLSTEMMEDESYGSDCESDGNHAIANHLDTKGRCVKDDEDYEDGEVRESVVHSTAEEPIPERMDTEDVKLNNHDTKDSPARQFASGSNADQFLLNEKESESIVHEDKTIECINESVGNASNENDAEMMDKDGLPQKLLQVGVAEVVADEKFLSSPSQGKPLYQSGKESVPEGEKKDIPSDGTTSSGRRTVTAIGERTNGNAKLFSSAKKPDSCLSIVESSFNGSDAAKDSVSGGNRSRIIHIPRTCVTSPGRTRSLADRSLSSRSGRDRYSDIEGGKFLLHRNRDEVDSNGPQRFIREKIYDQPYRSSRPYGRGRGRFSGRLDTSRGEWDTEREFALESYNSDYRFGRNKRASALTDVERESNEFVITPDGSTLSTGRGRKPLSDDVHSFHHLSSRRLSPGGRDGPTRDIRMLRRIPRNISPNRRNDENGSDLVGLQHDEKLVRSLPDEIVDPAYTRPQPIYDSGTGQFVRGNRNFSTVQRRGFPRVRSKSPAGPRARSPGPWSPPRRRSPDAFGGLPQLTQHRSAALYGMERIRSPERSCFPEEMVTRRRGSPSFIPRPSNDMRDVESGREHGHPRPMNSSRRSPSDRIFGRSTRRLDVSDPRIGAGEDEYFGRSVHSNRFHEFQGDGSSDERRKCSERRGFVRSFRPPYIGDGGNLRFHLDEGPRPYRFCAEGDTEFGGRTMREREFDGRIKNRPVVAPRRIRNIEDQEGNYRHGGQVWHDDGFNEPPGFKRRRF